MYCEGNGKQEAIEVSYWGSGTRGSKIDYSLKLALRVTHEDGS